MFAVVSERDVRLQGGYIAYLFPHFTSTITVKLLLISIILVKIKSKSENKNLNWIPLYLTGGGGGLCHSSFAKNFVRKERSLLLTKGNHQARVNKAAVPVHPWLFSSTPDGVDLLPLNSASFPTPFTSSSFLLLYPLTCFLLIRWPNVLQLKRCAVWPHHL